MNNSEFIIISNFEEIIEKAKASVKASNSSYELNFSLKVRFDIYLTKTPQLLDVVEMAEDFQKPECPKSLYLNHGKYITKDGVGYVISQLKNKVKGNRALISLINQKDILGSDDHPIPSFLILQFSLEDTELYVTAYFRALEVSKFFRINIEEIRLVIKKVYESIRAIKFVNLNVLAFRAYINENINPLVKPEIELYDNIKILKLMEKEPTKLASLLREKLMHSTVIEDNAIKIMSEIVNDSFKSQDINPCFKVNYMIKIIRDCLDVSNNLINLRLSTSYNKDIDELTVTYLNSLNKIIEEIEKCQ